MLVAVLDGSTVGTTWELLTLLWNARGLSGKSSVWYKSNAWHCKLSSLWVLGPVSRPLIHEVPGCCARWRLGHIVFVNRHNAEEESILSYLTSWTMKSQEVEYIYPFVGPTPPYSSSPAIYTPPASWAIPTSSDLHKTTPHVPKHTWWPKQLCPFPLGFFPLHATVS